MEFSETMLTFLGDNPTLLKNIVCLSADQNHEHWTNRNNNFWMRLSLFLFTSSGIMLSVCLPGCRSICRV